MNIDLIAERERLVKRLIEINETLDTDIGESEQSPDKATIKAIGKVSEFGKIEIKPRKKRKFLY